MIPLGDDLTQLERPRMTYLILAVTWAVWLFVERAGVDSYALAKSVCEFGLVPAALTHRAPMGLRVPIGPGLACVLDNSPTNLLTPITSMFVHGGWEHILGNSLFFWVFGKGIEDSMGSARFLVFYLICGLIGAALHVAVNAASPVPTIGASGAISGIMGAFLVLYPRARINMFFFFFVLPIRAWLVLLYWFGIQVVEGLPQLGQLNPSISGGVAVWAHVGGFLSGVLLVRLFAVPRLVSGHRSRFEGYPG